MKTIISTIITTAFIFTLTACGQLDYKKTSSGIAYKIFSEGKGPVIKVGQFVKFNLKVIKTDSAEKKDTLLSSSYGKLANYTPIDSSMLKGNQYSFLEVFPLMHVGDSAVCVLLVDSLIKKSGGMLPPFFKKGEKIMAYMRILDVFNNQDAVKADYDKAIEGEKAKELVVIEKYLKEKNITAQKTAAGVFVEIQKPGDGVKVDSGKSVTVMYTGKLFSGKVFDSNIDTTFKHTQPFTFTLGRGSVIKGWDDGLKLFKKGGKGRLFIPSSLAYGPRGAGADIEPFSNLMFDVEVVDVKDAPAQPAPATMPTFKPLSAPKPAAKPHP